MLGIIINPDDSHNPNYSDVSKLIVKRSLPNPNKVDFANHKNILDPYIFTNLNIVISLTTILCISLTSKPKSISPKELCDEISLQQQNVPWYIYKYLWTQKNCIQNPGVWRFGSSKKRRRSFRTENAWLVWKILRLESESTRKAIQHIQAVSVVAKPRWLIGQNASNLFKSVVFKFKGKGEELKREKERS